MSERKLKMSRCNDAEQIPLLWINLNRASKRRDCMNWALNKGGWVARRFSAIDGEQSKEFFFTNSQFPQKWNTPPRVVSQGRNGVRQKNRKVGAGMPSKLEKAAITFKKYKISFWLVVADGR